MRRRRRGTRAGAALALLLGAGLAPAQEGGYDPGFGDGGRTWIDVASTPHDHGRGLRVLADGTLFLGGDCENYLDPQVCVAWLDAHGNYAAGYGPGGSGRVRFDAFPGWHAGTSRYIDAQPLADGRVAVLCAVEGDIAFGLAVLKADGSDLDTSVGDGGFVTVLSGEAGSMTLYALAPQRDGRLVAAGYRREANGDYDMLALRLTSAFALDPAFGSGGYATIGFAPAGSSDAAYAVALQADGRVVLAGTATGTSTLNQLAIARLTASGAPDASFGPAQDGRYLALFGWASAGAQAVAIDAQGRLVFGGFAANGDTRNWLVGRLRADGTPDPAFHFGQPQIFPVGATPGVASEFVFGLALPSDRRILAGGTVPRSPSAYGHWFGVARFLDDGRFDPAFGSGGFSYGGLSDRSDDTTDEPSAIALAAGGLVVAGYTAIANGEVRFTQSKLRIDLVFANGFD